MSLVNLWNERRIFSPQLTTQLKETMSYKNNHKEAASTPKQTQNQNQNQNQSQPQPQPPNQPPVGAPFLHPHIQPPMNPLQPINPSLMHRAPHPYQWPLPGAIPPHHHLNPAIVLPSPFAPRLQSMPPLPKNTLHVSIGKIAELALELRRTGGGGTYVPLPMDKIPPIKDKKKNRNNDDGSDNDDDMNGDRQTTEDSKFRRAMDQYWKELCLIDSSRKLPSKSSKRSKSGRSWSPRKRRSGYVLVKIPVTVKVKIKIQIKVPFTKWFKIIFEIKK